MRCLTCYREDVKVSHAADVLKAEVPDLRAPTQKEGGEGQHCGDVANPNITDVDTPAGVLCQPMLCGGAAHLSSVSCIACLCLGLCRGARLSRDARVSSMESVTGVGEGKSSPPCTTCGTLLQHP